ncbi:MAG: YqaJ viral recombinase family protein [Thiocapsa sp.]|uniref:YqaJ viral recombinase family nuclease n=1 Tax=Thiocapsa sp. TaxID=2024551 RepID=UPI001BCAAF7A|nr:YqaJ viral recombinase family protein [Thiocapsa sp.]QVL49532.1 MAG: YqaJ viral recombinase family protein [Thiocapsa sp.]
MHVIDITQRTPEWHVWRNAGVSASDAAAVLGVSPYKTPWRLWAEKIGMLLPEDLSGNPVVRRGTSLEDTARRGFEERHDTLLLPLCGESDTHPVIRASFDGLDNNGIPVELKVPHESTYLQILEHGVASEAYRLYWHQVQCQIHVADAAEGWLVFHRAPGIAVDFRIPRDETFIRDTLVPRCLEFRTRVEKKQEPERDPERDLYTPSGTELATWTRLSGEYRRLAAEKAKVDAALKTLRSGLDGIESQLVALLGDFAMGESAGLRVLRYAVAGAIDYKAALADVAPDVDPMRLERYRRASSDRVRITTLKDGTASVPFSEAEVEALRHATETDMGFYF